MSRRTLAPDDDSAIEFLTEIVSIYSPSTREQAVAERAVETMSRLGYEAEIDPAGNAVGRIGSGRRRVLFLGHIDTVEGEILVRRERRSLWGRGSVDAKGPFAAFVMAGARASGATGLAVTVVGAVEEEAATSAGAYHVVENHEPADFVVVGEPSGWNRVTLGYKGRLLIDYTLEQPMTHTASRERGACEEAVDYWLAMREWATLLNRDKVRRFDTLDSSLRSISSGDDGLTEWARLTIGLRLPPDMDTHALQEKIRLMSGRGDTRTRGLENAHRATKRNDLTSAFLSSIRSEGGRSAFVFKTGTSDMNVVGPRWQCPIVASGPGDASLDHTPDEHLDLGEYLKAIRVLTRVIERLAALSQV